jgi:ADP-ribose pyrophosphatase YjhB (NUDIX family)
MPPIFNVRIYGILIENNAVLISDEIHYGQKITKFPGGGLQFGEGTIDCLKREFEEELNLDIEIIRHFYTVDFFKLSSFSNSQQVIGIYYLVSSKNTNLIKVVEERFKFEVAEDGQQVFRWIKIETLTPNDLTFPIDRHVVKLINENFTVQKK